MTEQISHHSAYCIKNTNPSSFGRSQNQSDKTLTAFSHSSPFALSDQALFEFVLIDAFSMLSVIAAIEPLRVANRIAGAEIYKWRIVSENGTPVTASNGLVIESKGRIGEGEEPDFCFICAGLGLQAEHPTRLSAFINRRFLSGARIGAISMGTIFLARAGLLNKKNCTIHWEGRPAFIEEFPDIPLSLSIFEIDDGVMTCAGGTSSFDLIMEILSNDHDETFVRKIANQLQIDRIRSNLFQQSTDAQYIPETAPKQVRQAIAILTENMEHPIPPKELAEAVGSSRRTLERLFLKFVGTTPSKFCKTQRLAKAHNLLLHSNAPILDVALATGFRSASYFSYCFVEQYGQSPSSMRQGLNQDKNKSLTANGVEFMGDA